MSIKRLIISLPCVLLTGCDTVGDFADDMGSHMPVVGERCEHWQCITEGGRRQSEINRQRRMQPPAPQPQPAPQVTPLLGTTR